MNNDKVVNVYIDILQKTLNDWLLQNVSLQANSKVLEDVNKEQAENIQQLYEKVEELTKTVNDLQQNNENEINSQVKSYKDKIENLENAVKDHLNTIGNLNTLKNEYENIKHQAQHVDTFRTELLKEREEHEKTRKELENKINEYQSAKNQAQNVEAFRTELLKEREEHQKTRRELENKINELNTNYNSNLDNLKTGYENQIRELGDKIEYLQLTPAKRKKVEEEKAKLLSPTESPKVVETKTTPKNDIIVEDGGTF